MNKITHCILLLMFGHAFSFAQNFVIDTIHYPAGGNEQNVAILSLGGSEGGFPSNDYVQEELPRLGYSCMAVAYFKSENTPENLSDIPLEYFKQAIDNYLSRPEIIGKQLVVIGQSKGGELALLLASMYSEINGVIAVVPSHVVWQGINADWSSANSSSWSYQGNPLPYVPYDTLSDKEYVELYQQSLEQEEYVEKAAIPVENIVGKILVLSGVEDKMWPSSFMGDKVIERLENNEFPNWYRHDKFDNAGHVFSPNALWFGGTMEGNKQAEIAYKKAVQSFLEIMDEN